MLLLLGWLVSTSFAAEGLRERVDAVGTAVSEDAMDDAISRLKSAIAAAPDTVEVVDARTVADLLYYQGLIPRKGGANRESDLDACRDALVIFPALPWNKAMLDSPDQQRVFEALRGEVGQRPAVATQVPESAGAAVMYVDGVRHVANQGVRMGKHFAQISCPGGKIVGVWTRFDKPVHWLKMCPEPVDTTAAAAPVAPVDEFGLDTDPRGGPEPLSLEGMQTQGPKRSKWTVPLLASAGGALVVSGAWFLLLSSAFLLCSPGASVFSSEPLSTSPLRCRSRRCPSSSKGPISLLSVPRCVGRC